MPLSPPSPFPPPDEGVNIAPDMPEFNLNEALINLKNYMASKKNPVEVQTYNTYSETLTYPLVPEVDPDGTKVLLKSRYKKLELLYELLHKDFKTVLDLYKKEVENTSKLLTKLSLLDKENNTLKKSSVDSAVIRKRMQQVCTELGISLPPDKFSTMEQTLDSFFGAIWPRLRTEILDDPLAD